MFAEFVLQDGLEEVPPERAMTGLVTVAGEQGIRNRAGGDLLFGKQRIIRGAELQAFGRIEAPYWPYPMQVGLIADLTPEFGGRAIESNFTPARPAAPQVVEGLVVLRVGIVTG